MPSNGGYQMCIIFCNSCKKREYNFTLRVMLLS